MPLTQEQIAEEQKKEKAFNVLSEQIIGLTGWGRFYPLMKAASDLGEGQINHKICLDEEGRNIKVYNTQAGKIVGAFIKPSHEHAGQYFGQKKYGKATLSLFGFGWYFKLKEQKEAICVIIKPDDVIARKAQIEEKIKEVDNNEKKLVAGIILLTIAVILLIYLALKK